MSHKAVEDLIGHLSALDAFEEGKEKDTLQPHKKEMRDCKSSVEKVEKEATKQIICQMLRVSIDSFYNSHVTPNFARFLSLHILSEQSILQLCLQRPIQDIIIIH